MTAPPPVDASKAAWRLWARSLEPVDTAVSEAVVEHLRRFLDRVEGDVAAYVGMADEISIDSLLGSECGQVRWILPRIGGDGGMSLHVDDGRRQVNAHGLAEPSPDAPEVSPVTLAAVVVPGRVFDVSGIRLGRGGGHYDRLVPQLAHDVPVIGVTGSARIVEALPAEIYDRPMTHLVTENGVTRPRSQSV